MCSVPFHFHAHALILDPAQAGAKLLRNGYAGHRDKRCESAVQSLQRVSLSRFVEVGSAIVLALLVCTTACTGLRFVRLCALSICGVYAWRDDPTDALLHLAQLRSRSLARHSVTFLLFSRLVAYLIGGFLPDRTH